MSDATDPTGADGPDFAEPVLGFRIWAMGDGELRGVAHDQVWVPGENVAVCHRAGVRHASAPAKDCRCGFNALHDLPPLASMYGDRYVAGAIAAWGDVEWHRTGFRAERACVLALCWDRWSTDLWKADAAETARSLGVELLAREDLAPHASRFARSLAPSARLQAVTREQPPASTCAPRSDRDRGWWIGRHVVADRESQRLTIGMAAALGRRIPRTASVRILVDAGPVEIGTAIAAVDTPSGTLSICSPVVGRVLDVNRTLLSEPGLLAADISEGGWVAHIRAVDRRAAESPLIWGRRGREGYAGFVRRVGPERMLDEVRMDPTPGDELAAMRERLRLQARRAAERLHAA